VLDGLTRRSTVDFFWLAVAQKAAVLLVTLAVSVLGCWPNEVRTPNTLTGSFYAGRGVPVPRLSSPAILGELT